MELISLVKCLGAPKRSIPKIRETRKGIVIAVLHSRANISIRVAETAAAVCADTLPHQSPVGYRAYMIQRHLFTSPLK